MLTQELNDKLIANVRGKLLPGTNLANVLMDILCIGREAVYRRLRGEVPFTLAEAAEISHKLDISLDSVSDYEDKGFAVVNVHFSDNMNGLTTYREMIRYQVDIYLKLAKDSTTHLNLACNVLPFMLSLNHDSMAKFVLFKWLYQRGDLPQGTRFNDFELPEDIVQLHKQYVAAARNINHAGCLLDHMIFTYLIGDLQYFFNIGLLKREDMDVIRKDLIALINELESIAVKGCFHTGKEAQFYISSINFDCTYGYVSGENTHAALLKICGVNLISSTEVKLFDQMKVWVESLRKFSTLISQCGEMQRITFFNKQRAAVEEL